MLACSCAVCLSKDKRDKRLRSSVLVEKGRTNLLIDAGPDLRCQLLKTGKTDIDAVLLTHFHRDHLGGLDDLRALIFHRQLVMQIYANQLSLEALIRQYEYADLSGDNLSDKFATLSLSLQNLEAGKQVQIGDILVRAVEVWHGNLSILGFVFDEELVYLTDLKYLDLAVCDTLRYKKILIINALRQEEHPTHLNLAEALALIEELQPQKAYLTHISHSLGLHAEITPTLPEEVSLAYDSLVLNV